MKVHEYQAKEILSRAGVAVPRGEVARTPEEAEQIAEGMDKLVVKAQVHAGGRGKAGGIKIVSNSNEAKQAAGTMLGTRLTTFQTGPEGVPVSAVLVEEALKVSRELYVGMVVDGAVEGVVLMASESGGVEIEEVAQATPEKILKVPIDPVLGLQPYQGRRIAYFLGIEPSQVREVTAMMASLYAVFLENDCSLVEINPLVVTAEGAVLAADAKINVDDDALFRHPELLELHDPEQEDSLEATAAKHGISYVKLDGDVGCMLNGAGLAMATMDVTTFAGTSPANFLDVGGGADEEKVAKALSIILSDPSVRRVLVNIFGGILRCDVVARGVIMAAEADPASMRPMVVRMLGTNAEEGRQILETSDLEVTLVGDLRQAAESLQAMA